MTLVQDGLNVAMSAAPLPQVEVADSHITTDDSDTEASPQVHAADTDVSNAQNDVDSGMDDEESVLSLSDDNEESAEESGPSQEDDNEIQQAVSNTSEFTQNSDSAESAINQSEVAAPSNEASSTSLDQVASKDSTDSTEDAEQATQEEAPVPSTTVTASSPSTQPTATVSDEAPGISDDAIDIQALVDNITARAAEADARQSTSSQNAADLPNPTQTSSLPPRPPITQQPAQSYLLSDDLGYQPVPSNPGASTMSSAMAQAPGMYSTGAPGTVPNMSASVPLPHPSIPNLPDPMQTSQYESTSTAPAISQAHNIDPNHQGWEDFLQEERRYVSEAKWDRFPEGSRLFIGNLSSERVSKKEVFDMFSIYGRLAQISLKQAYGFVQYYTVDDGQRAMDSLQGVDVRGRKIHLEVSRAQKKDADGDKRGNKSRKDSDRHEGNRGRRDDYRPARQPSPRRNNHRRVELYDGDHRNRTHHDGGHRGGRDRSRSPGFRRRDSDSYRRRSPSPYRPPAPAETELNIPRRYGADIPDVQFLLLQEVERDFIAWAQGPFINQGLMVQVMFLRPDFPRDAVIQRQIMEGVHAVVELDYHAQHKGKVPLQVFDRSGGRNNVRFDQYQDLDPTVAAQLVVRVKAQPHLQSPYGTSNGQFPPAQRYAPNSQVPYVPPAYANQPMAQPGTYANNAPASLDNATLQKLIGSIPPQQAGMAGQYLPPGGNAQVDMNALLASMGANGGAAPPPNHSGAYRPPYMQGGAGGGGDPAQHHVQNIMSQLSRYRQ